MRRRIRPHFLADDALAAEFQGALQEWADARPTDPAALLRWYPGFKRKARSLALSYASRWHRQLHVQHQAREEAVQAAMAAAAAGEKSAGHRCQGGLCCSGEGVASQRGPA
jgi:hypothetical protein